MVIIALIALIACESFPITIITSESTFEISAQSVKISQISGSDNIINIKTKSKQGRRSCKTAPASELLNRFNTL